MATSFREWMERFCNGWGNRPELPWLLMEFLELKFCDNDLIRTATRDHKSRFFATDITGKRLRVGSVEISAAGGASLVC